MTTMYGILLVLLTIFTATISQIVGNDGCCSDLAGTLSALQKSVDKLATVLEKQQECSGAVTWAKTHYSAHDYPVIYEDGARWRLFWWFKPNTTWPALVSDVLQDPYGKCDTSSPFCFSRLPEMLQENTAEMLGKDSSGNIYRWKFNSNNNVAHSVWQAFHDHNEVSIKDGNAWDPKVVKGKAPKATQDSFHYRLEHGVKSLQIDDDNCDCMTSLSIGHGMCLGSFSTTYGKENVYGVDLLYDSHCQTPSPKNGLYLYFRDDDDCVNVQCKGNSQCLDGIHSYVCA